VHGERIFESGRNCHFDACAFNDPDAARPWSTQRAVSHDGEARAFVRIRALERAHDRDRGIVTPNTSSKAS